MGLSNVVASGLMIIVMIQVFLLFSIKSIESITEVSRNSITPQPTNDLCSISGINVSISGIDTIVSVNISNTGSMEWWDYSKSYIILEILLTSNTKILTHNRIQDLSRSIYNDAINPGIVDPGEILMINYTISNLDPGSISSIKAVFSTQYGGECSAAK